LLTMPGTPFIYYGDEIGMQFRPLPSKEGGYIRTGSRTPMQWSDADNAGFSNAPADLLYLPVDEAADRPTVAGQESDPASLLNYVRQMIKMHGSLDALDADGQFEVAYAEDGKLPFVYTRAKNGQKLLVAINPANREVSVILPSDLTETAPAPVEVLGEASLAPVENGWALTLGGVSGVLYQMG